MTATAENIEALKELGFNEFKKGKFIYMDLRAYIFQDYIFFKYDGRDLPLIDKIESIKKIIEGIYEYKQSLA